MNEDKKQKIADAEAELNRCLSEWQQREYLPSDTDQFHLMNKIAKQFGLELNDYATCFK